MVGYCTYQLQTDKWIHRKMGTNYKVWFNGEIREFDDCTVHVQSHALHYGSSVFEGIRAYKTPQGTAFFRLDDHLKITGK